MCRIFVDHIQHWRMEGLHFVNGDTCSSGHIKRPPKVDIFHSWFRSINKWQINHAWLLIILSMSDYIVQVWWWWWWWCVCVHVRVCAWAYVCVSGGGGGGGGVVGRGEVMKKIHRFGDDSSEELYKMYNGSYRRIMLLVEIQRVFKGSVVQYPSWFSCNTAHFRSRWWMVSIWLQWWQGDGGQWGVCQSILLHHFRRKYGAVRRRYINMFIHINYHNGIRWVITKWWKKMAI